MDNIYTTHQIHMNKFVVGVKKNLMSTLMASFSQSVKNTAGANMMNCIKREMYIHHIFNLAGIKVKHISSNTAEQYTAD